MKKAIRIALGSGVLAAGLAFAGAPTANAQVRVRGSFPLPHGRVQVDIGDRGYGYGGFPIGGYVPYGYDVYEDPSYGYGFVYEDQWIACEPRGPRFVIIAAPVFYGGYRSYGYRNYGYRNYGYRNYGYRDYRYSRPYRNDRHGYSRDYGRNDGRSYRRNDNYRRDDRRSRDSRDGRNDRRSGSTDRRWNR
jgi:hypothetical protein